MNKLKKIPKFKNEDEEREFWATHDSTDYIDWSKASRDVSFPNLRPSNKMISLRLPLELLFDIKSLASERDVPYQSFIKMILYDRVREERHSNRPRKKQKA